MNRATILFFALALISLGGCGSTPKVDPKFDAEAKRFAPEAGKANLYVVRENVIGSSLGLDVLVDDRVVGSLVPGTFLLLSVAPGRHTVQPQATDAQPSGSCAIDAEAGKNYFVAVAILRRPYSAQLSVEPLSDADGRKEVGAAARAEPSSSAKH